MRGLHGIRLGAAVIAALVFTHANAQGLTGDINGDGRVDMDDVAALATLFYSRDPAGDLNEDGLVNVADLAILKSTLSASDERISGGTVFVWLEPAVQNPSLSARIALDLWMDFSADHTLGGGINVFYDSEVLGYEHFENDPAFPDDPGFRRAPDTGTFDVLSGLAFGNFEGIGGPHRIGTFTFTARTIEDTALDMGDTADGVTGPFVSAATFLAQDVTFTGADVAVGPPVPGSLNTYTGGVIACTIACTPYPFLIGANDGQPATVSGMVIVDAAPGESFDDQDLLGFAIRIGNPGVAYSQSADQDRVNPLWVEPGSTGPGNAQISGAGTLGSDASFADGQLVVTFLGGRLAVHETRLEIDIDTQEFRILDDDGLVASGTGFFAGQPPVPGYLAAFPDVLDLGAQNVGQAPLGATITVSNPGGTSVTVGEVGATDPLATPFAISADNCSFASLDSLQTCTITVEMSTGTVGVFADSLDVQVADLSLPALTISVSGEVIPSHPVLTLEGLPADFGELLLGESQTLALRVSNTGFVTLEIGAIGVTDPLLAPFAIEEDECSGAALLPDFFCEFDLSFTPDEPGEFADNFNIPSNDPESPLLTIPVSGTALPASARIDYPSEVVFATVGALGSTTRELVLSNSGTLPLEIGVLGGGNPLAEPFAFETDGCSLATLAPAAACQVVLRFSPTNLGVFEDSLDVPSSDPDNPLVEVEVRGEAVDQPVCAIRNEHYDFGELAVGGGTGEVAVTVVNVGAGVLQVDSVGVLDNPGAPFTVLDDECSTRALTQDQECAVRIQVSTLDTGNFEDRFEILSNDPYTPRAEVTLQASVNPLHDLDGDTLANYADNCTLVDNLDQRDTDADGYGNVCDPDLDNDGQVNFTDLALLKESFYFVGEHHADLDGDGLVSFVDLGILKAHFLGTPGPSGLHP